MIGKKLNSSRQISLSEVKELLREKPEGKELGYEQDMTLKYVKKFSRVPKAKVEELIEELKLIEGIEEAIAIRLADLMPEEKETIVAVLPKGTKFSEEQLGQALKIIEQYRK